jgi:hypothetical protein
VIQGACGRRRGASVRRLQRVGHHACCGQRGTTKIKSPTLSKRTFWRNFEMRALGGYAYSVPRREDHWCDRLSVPSDSKSWFQLKYEFACRLCLLAKRSYDTSAFHAERIR